jgi:hypothetical protein
MRKLWKGLLLGAAVGGAVKAAQEVQGEAPIEEVGPAVAKSAGQAALAGAAVGFLLDRRDRRKLSKLQKAKAKAGIGTMVAGAGALADVAIPALQHAAKAAKPKLEAAADAARPVMKAAAATAKEKGAEAAKAAKPRLEAAATAAKPRIEAVTDAAKAKLAEIEHPVLVAV